jgi:hypothetical protein
MADAFKTMDGTLSLIPAVCASSGTEDEVLSELHARKTRMFRLLAAKSGLAGKTCPYGTRTTYE